MNNNNMVVWVKLDYDGCYMDYGMGFYCLDNKIQIPGWNIQSANPVGKENINSLLFNAKKHLETII